MLWGDGRGTKKGKGKAERGKQRAQVEVSHAPHPTPPTSEGCFLVERGKTRQSCGTDPTTLSCRW